MENNTPQQSQGLSEDNKTIIVILLLVFAYPIGLVLMFVWMKKWPTWIKLLIALPRVLVVLLFVFGIGAGILLAIINPAAKISEAKCSQYCSAVEPSNTSCVADCTTEGWVASYNTDSLPHLINAEKTARQILSQAELPNPDIDRLSELSVTVISEAKAVTEKQPDNAEGWAYLGAMYAGFYGVLEDADINAISALENAAKLDSTNYEYPLALGDIYVELENVEMAKKYYEQALELTPVDSEMHDHLVEILAMFE